MAVILALNIRMIQNELTIYGGSLPKSLAG